MPDNKYFPSAFRAFRCRYSRWFTCPPVPIPILACFLASCLQVTLRKRLAAQAPGLTPRAVLETLSGALMLDVHLPLADGR